MKLAQNTNANNGRQPMASNPTKMKRRKARDFHTQTNNEEPNENVKTKKQKKKIIIECNKVRRRPK
jgi:hypothetical protein